MQVILAARAVVHVVGQWAAQGGVESAGPAEDQLGQSGAVLRAGVRVAQASGHGHCGQRAFEFAPGVGQHPEALGADRAAGGAVPPARAGSGRVSGAGLVQAQDQAQAAAVQAVPDRQFEDFPVCRGQALGLGPLQ